MQRPACCRPSCSWKLFVNSVSGFVPSQDLFPRLYHPFVCVDCDFLPFVPGQRPHGAFLLESFFLFQTLTSSHNILSQMSSSSEPAAS